MQTDLGTRHNTGIEIREYIVNPPLDSLFFGYGVICSPQTLLWSIVVFPEYKSTRSRSTRSRSRTCFLKLRSIQQLIIASYAVKHATCICIYMLTESIAFPATLQ